MEMIATMACQASINIMKRNQFQYGHQEGDEK